MTKYIVDSFYSFYGVSKFDFNCNFLNPFKDIHKYIHTVNLKNCLFDVEELGFVGLTFNKVTDTPFTDITDICMTLLVNSSSHFPFYLSLCSFNFSKICQFCT